MTKLTLSVLIINWNTRQLLKECLQSIYQQSHQLRFEVIVVDNGSQDGSAQMVRQHFPQVRLLQNSHNVGFATANNQAAKLAQGEFLLLLNSDTVLHQPIFDQLVAFARQTKAGVVGPKLVNTDGSLQPSAGSLPSLISIFSQQGLPLHKLRLSSWPVLQSASPEFYAHPRQVGWVSGACLLTPRKLYRQLSGLDETIFMYMEEVDYCARVQQTGRQIWLLPEVQVMHVGAGSSTTGRHRPIVRLHQGLYYYFAKHHPRWQLVVLWLILLMGACLRWVRAPRTYYSVVKINPWHPFA